MTNSRGMARKFHNVLAGFTRICKHLTRRNKKVYLSARTWGQCRRRKEDRFTHGGSVARWMKQGRRICCAVAAAILVCAAAAASADAAGASILEVHPQDVNWTAQVSSLRAGTVLFNAGKYTGCGTSINAGRGSYLRPARARWGSAATLCTCSCHAHALTNVCTTCVISVLFCPLITRHSCLITVHGVGHAR